MHTHDHKKSVVSALGIAVGATAAATVGLPATAHADSDTFQTPSGNITCAMLPFNGTNRANCQIINYTYQTPPKPPDCNTQWGDNWHLDQGNANVPYTECHSGTNALPPIPTLDYGQTRTLGALICTSEPSGVRCTDNSTGHFFRLSRDSYQLG